MDKKDFENSLTRQARDTEKMVRVVFDSVTAQLGQTLTTKEVFDAQKIFITGCGDSWLAGVACKAAFESITKVETHVMRAVEFSRHLNGKNLGYSPNTPMVLVISYSGEATRAVECALRATERGANTIAITNDPNSRLAKACRHTVCVGLPEGGEYFPGGTTYIASMTALMLIAMRVGRIRETISGETYLDMRQALLDYAHDFQKEVEGLYGPGLHPGPDLEGPSGRGLHRRLLRLRHGLLRLGQDHRRPSAATPLMTIPRTGATSTISWPQRRPSAG